MQEGKASEITLRDMKGPILKDLVASMYGALEEITPEHLLPLFLAADAHQVGCTDMRPCMSDLSVALLNVVECLKVECMNAALYVRPELCHMLS